MIRTFSILAVSVMFITAFGGLSGCNVIGYVAHSVQQDVPQDVPARFRGLDNQRVAVMVQSSSFVYGMSPQGPDKVGYGLGAKLQAKVEGITVLPKDLVDRYQRQNRGWIAYEPSRIMKDLGVDRVVLVDLYEYRTHEPGNPHVKMGVMAANFSVLSQDEYDPNTIAFQSDVRKQWPEGTEVGTVTVDAAKVEQITFHRFIRDAARLFYDHTVTPSEDG